MESTYDTTQQGSISRTCIWLLQEWRRYPHTFLLSLLFLSLSLSFSSPSFKEEGEEERETRCVEKQGSNILKIQEQERINGCGNEERMREEGKNGEREVAKRKWNEWIPGGKSSDEVVLVVSMCVFCVRSLSHLFTPASLTLFSLRFDSTF